MKSERVYNACLLSAITRKKLEKNTNLKYSVILSNSAKRGIIPQNVQFDKNIANEENIDRYYVVKVGDFIYNPRISTTAPCGPINQNDCCDGVVSPLYTVFSCKPECVYDKYLKFYFQTSLWHEYIRSVANTGARHDRMNVSDKDFFSMLIKLPPIAEQQKIAEILSAQDRVIELKTKLLEEKKRLKKYLCQVLISGESQSEGKKILFKELFEFLNNNSCSRAQMKEKGTIYNVHYGDILTKYGELLDAKKDEVPCICVNINLSKYDRLQNGDIVFADTAEDLQVGKSTELKNVGNKHIIAGLHTIAARPIKDCFIPGWLGYYTNSPSYRRQLYTCAQGSKVISILRKDIIDTIVDVPDKTIQKKVVTVLDIISDEIKKIRIVIEQEKLKKKALMQQLLTGKVRVSV